MKMHMQQDLKGRTHSPTRQDRLVVLFISVGIFLLLLPLAQNIHPQVIGWIVMGIVIGLPVVMINVLLPFSRWEIPSTSDGSSSGPDQNRDQKRTGALHR